MAQNAIDAALGRLHSLFDLPFDAEKATRWAITIEREVGKINPAFLDEAVTRYALEPITELPPAPRSIIIEYNAVAEDYAQPDNRETFGGVWRWATEECAQIGLGETKRQLRVDWLKNAMEQQRPGQPRRAIKLMLWREINRRPHLTGNAVTSSSNNTGAKGQ